MMKWILTTSLGLLCAVTPVTAQEGLRAPVQETIADVGVQRILVRPSLLKARSPGAASAMSLPRGECPEETWTHTDSDWQPGEYILQAGFAQGETAAASYTLPAEKFPVKLDRIEMLFATSNAFAQTTTHWTVRIYQGTPSNGTLIGQYSSDDVLMPHLVMPPGTTGTILQFIVDPGDPEQIYIEDDGSQTFTVGFRIDQHNDPGTPCLEAPDPNNNAFPCTDTSGLDSPSGNWIDMVSGTFCVCGTGWSTFQSLPSICRPSGDWVLRAAVTPQDCVQATGACCRTNGTCTDDMAEQDCLTIGGEYQGDDTICSDASCPQPTGACCVESSGGCVDVPQDTCETAGGIFNAGESCDTITCFPIGACCLDDGSCAEAVSPETCSNGGGVFQGDGTSCADTDCPLPIGACCLTNGNCVDVNEDNCDVFDGDWAGAGSFCEDQNACEDCLGDINGDLDINVEDLLIVIAEWGETSGPADINEDGIVNVNDLLIVIASWGDCPF